VQNELNYQLTEEMTEYRDELEQMLFQLPLAGSEPSKRSTTIRSCSALPLYLSRLRTLWRATVRLTCRPASATPT
jgi:hypothetical protein